MRTRTAFRLALLTSVAFSPLLARPGLATIDAVDEPDEVRPPRPPRPATKTPRVRTPSAEQPDPASEANPDEIPEADHPPPARRPLPTVAPPEASAADAGPAPAKVAGPVPAPSQLRPIAMPQGGFSDLLSHFRAREQALLEQDVHHVEPESRALRDLKVELGFRDFLTVGEALAREGQRRLAGKLGSQARASARLATELAPDLPAAWWLLARSEIAAAGLSGTGAASRAALTALRAELRDPLSRRALLTNLGISAVWAALAALLVALALLSLRALRYALHDFHHLFPKGAAPFQTYLLGLILLALPWLFNFGPFAIMATLAAMAWLYLDSQGQAVASAALVLALITPLILGELVAHTTVGTLGLDLWTAERDLDADDAVGRLRAVVQDPQVSYAVPFVLAHRAKRLGQIADAEPLYRKALQLAPGRADVENDLANTLVLKGDLKGAQALYESAIDHDPGNAATYFNLGQAFSRLLQLEQSQEAQRHALELDRQLIEDHMAQDLRANRYVIDLPLDFDDVAGLGVDVGQASRSIREQAAMRLFGPLESVWPAMAVMLLLTFLGLRAGRKRLAPSAACRKCGRPVCSRCDPGLPNEGLCGQCVSVFLRKSVADPPARIRKEARVKAYQALRLRVLRLIAVASGAGGHIVLGEELLGTGLLFLLLFFVILASGGIDLVRPPEPGIVATSAAWLSALLLVVVYLVSVRDLFGKIR